MRVISKSRLKEFQLIHPRATRPLDTWYQIVSRQDFADFNALKSTFGASVDNVAPLVVFDIGGNKYRLIASIHFNTNICYVRHILTHAEYDLDRWKK